MKIESIIQRSQGTTVQIGDQNYHFAPGEDGRHVCDVEDEAHINRFLSIKEGYRAVDVVVAASPVPPVPPVDPEPGVKTSEPEPQVKPARKPRATKAGKIKSPE